MSDVKLCQESIPHTLIAQKLTYTEIFARLHCAELKNICARAKYNVLATLEPVHILHVRAAALPIGSGTLPVR